MAVDYSLIVTWTYFSIYVLTFLVVSVLCAIKVKKEYKRQTSVQDKREDNVASNVSKTKFVKRWAKLLWAKKKVYLQLIPHLFDQATDFGVIFEYYRLATEEDDIGINAWYLFYISIAVIIIYRIISSIAIYQLTHNCKYVIYQIFDLLMIQCIYTNYELDTDEPSNAQRYLQVLEATFEVN